MATISKPREVLISGATVKELTGNQVEVTAPGGAKQTMKPADLTQLKKMLASLSPPSSTTQALAKSARLFGTPSAALLVSAVNVGKTLVAMSRKYGLAFTADIAGAHLKTSIDNLIFDARKGQL